MWDKIKYLYSKLVVYLQIASVRESNIDSRSWIGERANLIRVKLGKYSYVGRNCAIVNTEIGAFCSIGSNCSLGGGEHPTTLFSTSTVFYDKSNCFKEDCFIIESLENFNTEPKTFIGNDVWIGEKVFVKAGIKVGTGAVIGAHSVVTKDVPPYAIVAGIPAKVLKYRFSESTIKELLNSEWWNKSNDDIVKFIPYLYSVSKKNNS